MPRFNLDNYISVQDRINAFWQDHPQGRILTTMESDPLDFGQCRYKAEVFEDRDDARPVATGWAFEVAGGGGANSTSHEENCETSAIGRALANMGYATMQQDRPSREEMAKVNCEPSKGPARPNEPAVPFTGGNQNKATEPQLKAIYAKVKTAGWSEDDARGYVKDVFNKASSRDLTIAEASAMIKHLDATIAQQPPLVVS